MKNFFKKNENGQGMVEYGLIIGLVAVIVVAIFIALGPQIKKMFGGTTPSEKIESAVESPSEIASEK